MRITSDGTSKNTEIIDDNGINLHNVNRIVWDLTAPEDAKVTFYVWDEDPTAENIRTPIIGKVDIDLEAKGLKRISEITNELELMHRDYVALKGWNTILKQELRDEHNKLIHLKDMNNSLKKEIERLENECADMRNGFK